MKKRLPVVSSTPAPLTAERLFRERFLPLYPLQARTSAGLAALRAADANPSNNPAIFRALEETADLFANLAPHALGVTTLCLDRTDASIHRLSRELTTKARDKLFSARRDTASTNEPPLLIHFVAHAAIYIGACAVANHGGQWLVRSPLWETRVALASKAGKAEIAPFSWLLRCLSDEGDTTTLADRYRTHVEVPFADVDSWPVLVDPHKRVPRLSGNPVRYDAVVRHWKAHLSGIQELGEDFPTPERFTELGFRWLEFLVVGAGRAVIVHGPARERGIHLFWLGQSGFMKAAYFDVDAPAASAEGGAAESHRVTIEQAEDPGGASQQVVLVSIAKGNEKIEHRMMWWGP